MSYQLIIFDLGNVIVKFDHKIIAQALAKISGIPIMKLVKLYVTSGLGQQFDEGKISAQEFFRKVKSKLALEIGFEEFKKIWNEIFTPLPEIEQLILKLKPRYKIFVLSNTNKLHFDYLRKKLPVLNQVDRFILSYRLKTMKPHPRTFKVALKQAKVKPQATIFVDDQKSHIEMARKLGLSAIHFRSVKQLERNFKKRGVLSNNDMQTNLSKSKRTSLHLNLRYRRQTL